MKIILPALVAAGLALGAPAAFAQTSTSAPGAGVAKDDQGMSKGTSQGMSKDMTKSKKHASKHKKQKHAKSMGGMGSNAKPMDYSGSTSAPGAGVAKDDQDVSKGMTKGKKHATKHKKQKQAKSMGASTTGSKAQGMDNSGSSSAPGAGVNKDDSKKK